MLGSDCFETERQHQRNNAIDNARGHNLVTAEEEVLRRTRAAQPDANVVCRPRSEQSWWSLARDNCISFERVGEHTQRYTPLFLSDAIQTRYTTGLRPLSCLRSCAQSEDKPIQLITTQGSGRIRLIRCESLLCGLIRGVVVSCYQTPRALELY